MVKPEELKALVAVLREGGVRRYRDESPNSVIELELGPDMALAAQLSKPQLPPIDPLHWHVQPFGAPQPDEGEGR